MLKAVSVASLKQPKHLLNILQTSKDQRHWAANHRDIATIPWDQRVLYQRTNDCQADCVVVWAPETTGVLLTAGLIDEWRPSILSCQYHGYQPLAAAAAGTVFYDLLIPSRIQVEFEHCGLANANVCDAAVFVVVVENRLFAKKELFDFRVNYEWGWDRCGTCIWNIHMFFGLIQLDSSLMHQTGLILRWRRREPYTLMLESPVK